jgi:hypothetical protein
MSIQLTAPFPLNQTTTIIPNPVWNDSYNLKDEIETKYAVDGILYTYVKRQGHRRRLLMQCRMTLYKSLELQAFFRSYYSSKIYVKDWLNQEWVGYAVNSPYEFVTDERGGPGGGAEYVSVSLEFEVVPLGYEGEL